MMLSNHDLSRAVTDKAVYRETLRRSQEALALLTDQLFLQQRPVVVVFEAWEGAGKGKAIKRLTERLDPRGYSVHAISAPSGEAATHHFLWRFWQLLPSPGRMAIFDRSWYRRVLGDRLSGQVTGAAITNAYLAINDFERHLVDFGTPLFKFWLQISPQEQLHRIEQRAADDNHRQQKLADGREQRAQMDAAWEQVLAETDTVIAPWTIIEADDKRFASLKILDGVVRGLSQALDFDPLEQVEKTTKPSGKKAPRKKKKKK